MKYFVWSLVGLLIVLHQDFWQWNNGSIVFGFMPYSLVYHCGISIAAATVWLIAVNVCWPSQLDELEESANLNDNDAADSETPE